MINSGGKKKGDHFKDGLSTGYAISQSLEQLKDWMTPMNTTT